MQSDKAAQSLILRGGMSAGFGFFVRFGARFLFLFVAGQLYGAALFGAYSLAVAVVELGAMVGGVGTRKVLFQLLDRNEEAGQRQSVHVVMDAIVLVSLVSLSLAGLIIAAVAFLPSETLSPNSRLAIMLIAPLIAGQALLDLLTAATRWKHKMRYEVISRSFVEPYAGIAAAIGAWFAGYSEIGLVISYWAGTLAAMLASLWGVGRVYGGFDLLKFSTSLAQLWQTLRGTVANTGTDFFEALFTRLDLYLVGILLGESAAGIYNMARQLRTPIRQIKSSLDTLLAPITSRTLGARGTAETGQALASVTRMALAIQLPILIALVVIGKPLLEVFGTGFSAGYTAMIIITVAELIQASFGFSLLILIYRGPWHGLGLTAFWSAVGIIACLLLIPQFGIEGAAGSALIAYSGMAIHRRILLARRFDVHVPLRNSAGPLLSGAIGLAASLVVGAWVFATGTPISLTITLLAGLASYALALWLWLKWTGESLSLRGFVTGSTA